MNDIETRVGCTPGINAGLSNNSFSGMIYILYSKSIRSKLQYKPVVQNKAAMISNIPVVIADSNEVLSYIFTVVTIMSQSSVDRFTLKIPSSLSKRKNPFDRDIL